MADKAKTLKDTFDTWDGETVAKLLSKRPERQPRFETSSGFEAKRLYTPLDVKEQDYSRDLGFPGQYPFTRGVQPTMFRGRFWTMRQYAGFATATETNKRFRFLLDQGQTGLSIAFDLPTQMGYDPDDPMARGEVGKVGVSIASIEDMRRLFDQIPLAKVSTSMTINSTAAIIMAMYVAVAEEQGAEPTELRGTIQNDLLKEYIARGTYIFPPRPSLRITTDLFAHCREQMPKWNTISISGYHMREAGSTAAQEIAFTLANGIAYVQAAIDTGLQVDEFAGRLSFFFSCHNVFLEEVSKFRAARRLWARIMRERFGAEDPRSWAMRFHTQTAGVSLMAQQPDNNVVRVAMQALAAVLGGTNSLHTNSRDEALALPSEQSVQIALRTQQIIANESGVADIVDPLGGSWAVESMTDRLEAEAVKLIEKIDEMGGAVKAIENGFQQQAIGDAAYAYQKNIESGDQVIVGLNKYTVEEELAYKNLLRVSPEVEQAACVQVQALRAKRDQAAADAAISAVAEAAAGEANLFPPVLVAVRAGCTTGEIANSLRGVFGTHQEG